MSPIEGHAADKFGAGAPFLIASSATLLGMLLSFGLTETTPARSGRTATAPAAVGESAGA